MMVAVFALLAIAAPGAIARAGDGLVQAVVTGLATHSGGPRRRATPSAWPPWRVRQRQRRAR